MSQPQDLFTVNSGQTTPTGNPPPEPESRDIVKMAAEINSDQRKGNVRKPILKHKIEGSPDTVNQAVLIPKEDGVISVSDDKTLRVWLLRDSGQYWPSICHNLPAEAACLDYNASTRRLFVGLGNGTITEFEITEDYNRLIHHRDYIAHTGRVTAVKFSVACEWVLSCSKDKYFMWHCSETGRRLGGYQANAACLCLEFDEQSKHTFIGDYSGQVSMLKLKENSFDFVTSLKGHSGSIRCLSWDPHKQLLFSGSFDQSVIVWDIGSKKGTVYELQGHREKVQGLVYVKGSRDLMAASDDGILGVWDMEVKREETPNWSESDQCEKCEMPFFWNFRKMWADKKVGMRQHHCRLCGKAFCHPCCSQTSTIPLMGYEYEVRVCEECIKLISPEDKAPHATFYDVKHGVVDMNFDETRKVLLTTGKDRVMKIWDMKDVLH